MYLYTLYLLQAMYSVKSCLSLFRHALANRSISKLIHLARWVKFNPRFNPGLALIGVCGMQFNHGLNFNPVLGHLTLG